MTSKYKELSKRYDNMIKYQNATPISKVNNIFSNYNLSYKSKSFLTKNFIVPYFTYMELSKKFDTNKDYELPKSISPDISLCNDYTIKNINNHRISSKISIVDFINGRNLNIINGFLGGEFVKDEEENVKKYIINAQDLLTKNGKFINNEIYNNNINIEVNNKKIFINNRNFNDCSDYLKKSALYEIISIQQHIQHLCCHIIITYGYNLLKSHKIDELIKNDIVFATLMEYCKNYRHVTEGYGKTALFANNDNAFGLNEEEIKAFVKYLPKTQNILFDNLLDGHLILKKSRHIYIIFIKKINQYIDIDTINIISRKLNISKKQTKYMIYNLLFLSTYFHNKTHVSLNNVVETPILKILVDQIYYCIQFNKLNEFLQDIKSNINSKYENEGELITNGHFDG